LVKVLNYSNWLTFSRTSSCANNSLRFVMYINIRFSSLCFSLCKDIFNHRDISIISFFNQNDIFFLINVYSDSSQLALKCLKNTEANINNVLIMISILETIFEILTTYTILSIVTYCLILLTLFFLVFPYLLTEFLLGVLITIKTLIQS